MSVLYRFLSHCHPFVFLQVQGFNKQMSWKACGLVLPKKASWLLSNRMAARRGFARPPIWRAVSSHISKPLNSMIDGYNGRKVQVWGVGCLQSRLSITQQRQQERLQKMLLLLAIIFAEKLAAHPKPASSQGCGCHLERSHYFSPRKKKREKEKKKSRHSLLVSNFVLCLLVLSSQWPVPWELFPPWSLCG